MLHFGAATMVKAGTRPLHLDNGPKDAPLRAWLIESAHIAEHRVLKIMDTLDAEEVDTLEDLQRLRRSPRFAGLFTEITGEKIAEALDALLPAGRSLGGPAGAEVEVAAVTPKGGSRTRQLNLATPTAPRRRQLVFSPVVPDGLSKEAAATRLQAAARGRRARAALVAARVAAVRLQAAARRLAICPWAQRVQAIQADRRGLEAYFAGRQRFTAYWGASMAAKWAQLDYVAAWQQRLSGWQGKSSTSNSVRTDGLQKSLILSKCSTGQAAEGGSRGSSTAATPIPASASSGIPEFDPMADPPFTAVRHVPDAHIPWEFRFDGEYYEALSSYDAWLRGGVLSVQGMLFDELFEWDVEQGDPKCEAGRVNCLLKFMLCPTSTAARSLSTCAARLPCSWRRSRGSGGPRHHARGSCCA